MLNTDRLGAHLRDDGSAEFLVWGPDVEQIDVYLPARDSVHRLKRGANGYHRGEVKDIRVGEHYFFRLDGEKDRPDPASRWQPEGVHGPSALVASAFAWDDMGWVPPSLRNTVIYELHTGTFTSEGTFDAIIPHLPRLKELGITTIELMPVNQFTGERNWGYDGVNLYAPHHDYGGAVGLKRLVNACHKAGIGVYLDVVYNHLGPEGNYLWDYGPYFTERYHTPWGASLNFDGPGSDHVRRFFIENAIYWLDEYHIDGLRLDATHALFDFSAVPFLEALTASVQEWANATNRHVHLIAENDRSDRKLLLPREAGGTGLDGIWLDDLHHALHYALTGEDDGYYADYADFDLLVKVLREGFAYTGQYSPARDRHHGTPSRDIPADRFVVCTQNHDQIGNRMLGERLSQLTDFDGLKLAAGILACSPYVPLLFMGEEYGETAPFLYFVSHGDAGLVEAVQKGRAEEFAAFRWKGEPPDPQAADTFQRCKLNHDLREKDHHALLYRLYSFLLKLRATSPALTNPRREDTSVHAEGRLIWLDRHAENQRLRIAFNFDLANAGTLHLPRSDSPWRLLCDSNAAEWLADNANGDGNVPDFLPAGTVTPLTLEPKSFAIYMQITED